MDDKNFNKAKELFFHYCGSLFHMSREGDYTEYKTYNISKEQELIWKNELVEKWVNQLSFKDTLAFLRLVMIAENYHDYNVVKRLIRYVADNIDRGDSLIKLVYAEVLLNIVCPKELTKAKVGAVGDLLRSVSDNPITVDSSWTKKGFSDKLPDEEYIINRLKKDLAHLAEAKSSI